MSLKRLLRDDLAVAKPVGPRALALVSDFTRFDQSELDSPESDHDWSSTSGSSCERNSSTSAHPLKSSTHRRATATFRSDMCRTLSLVLPLPRGCGSAHGSAARPSAAGRGGCNGKRFRDSRMDAFVVVKKDTHSLLAGNVATRAGDDGFDVASRSTKPRGAQRRPRHRGRLRRHRRRRKRGARQREPHVWTAGVLVATWTRTWCCSSDPCAHCDQHLEMLNTRYLRLLQEAADGRCPLAGCTVGVRFTPNLGERTFRLRHSVGVWAY
jgi:hypothetical protein